MSVSPERDDCVPDIVPGEVVHSDNGDLAYKVIKQVTRVELTFRTMLGIQKTNVCILSGRHYLKLIMEH